MSRFIDDGYFASHLRRMRAVYGAKRSALIRDLTPLSELGWTWSDNPAGMHLLVQHDDGEYVRAVAASIPLELSLLSFYRAARMRNDGLFLRFGSLASEEIHDGALSLVDSARI